MENLTKAKEGEKKALSINYYRSNLRKLFHLMPSTSDEFLTN